MADSQPGVFIPYLEGSGPSKPSRLITFAKIPSLTFLQSFVGSEQFYLTHPRL
jgi:hypothetical protein